MKGSRSRSKTVHTNTREKYKENDVPSATAALKSYRNTRGIHTNVATVSECIQPETPTKKGRTRITDFE